ncbi:helix-turn-helix domain-containing protein [Enterococcus pernyi]|uniref:helix-turn-helix domain-containing protein n=1 Tax=Enterococcus pernyi TaxID=590158 RepID=UPI000789AE64|nr:helix-turn-helix domain-containing protein [Enterococcus pernyi]
MNRLRQLREEKGYSLRQLGLEVDMNASVLGNYERGDRQPRIDVWEKLANFFNVSTPYIMGISNERNEMDDLLKKKINNMLEKKSFGNDENNEVAIFIEILLNDITQFINSLLHENDRDFQIQTLDAMSDFIKLMSAAIPESENSKIESLTYNLSFLKDLYTGSLFYGYHEDNKYELLDSGEVSQRFLESTISINENFNKTYLDWFKQYYD